MLIPPVFDAALLARYDRPGPRYTSYPTALQFHAGFGTEQWRTQIERSNGDPLPRPLSLYVHVPYCSSPCFYCGCNRVITRDKGRGAALAARLCREIRMVAPLFDRDRPVVQLHFGGGTPNFLAPAQLALILDHLGQAFTWAGPEERDFSIELDPRSLDPASVRQLFDIGLNRASLGVQDFDPAVQAAVNRVQDCQQTLELIDACRTAGMRSVNVDLMYGLPLQTLDSFGRTLEQVLTARPDRLAVYGYAHLPQKFRAQRQIDATQLPDAALRIALLGLAIERLGAAGYQYIGMDHFALPTDPLAIAQRNGRLHRNFMGYTTHVGCDLVGFGPSAISHVDASYSQNWREPKAWETAVDAGRLPLWGGLLLDRDDQLRAAVIQQWMCHGEIRMADIAALHGIEFQSYFDAELTRLDSLRADGLVAMDATGIRATDRGRLLLRTIAMCFDRYLHAPARPAPPADLATCSQVI